MYDPIGGFRRMVDQFMVYLDTAYRIEDPGVSAARTANLIEPGQLALEPIFETIPRYVQWDHGLEELVVDRQGVLRGFDDMQRRAFVELTLAGLFDAEPDPSSEIGAKGRFRPYRHQIDMLRRGVQDGTPGIVTSGTGSGKTESFMLPLLAQITKEAVSWPKPLAPLDDNWLEPHKRFRLHRATEHPERPKALRAIVLYPLNALVEDQMVRLRKAIDSPAARAVMDRHFNGNRIFFGRYTGQSPVTGWRAHPRRADDDYWKKRSRRATAELKKQLRNYRDVQRRIASEGKAEEELRYLFPSTDGGELIARWDMQETPPDILVTNQSILNAILVREIDAPIVSATRDWLDTEPNARFTLVLDELHLVRGSAGAEMATLLRVLIEKLGLNRPQNAHKLRILCSSASLPMDGENEESSIRYLKSMFGRAGTAGADDLDAAWSNSVVTGEMETTTRPTNSPSRGSLHEIADALEKGTEGYGQLRDAILRSARSIDPGMAGDEAATLEHATRTAAGMLEFATQDQSRGGKRLPTTVGEIGRRLFGSPDDAAVRGLLTLRAIPDLPQAILPIHLVPDRGALATLPSFRMHTFVRNVEGMFASVSRAADGTIAWGKPGIERGLDYDADTPEPRRRLFELLYCEACGELYVGGKRGETQQSSRMVSLLPAPQELERLPEVATSLRFEDASFGEFAMFWPGVTEPVREFQQEPTYAWCKAWLDPPTGLISPEELPGGVPGYYLNRPIEVDDRGRDRAGPGTAVPYCCAKCGTDYSGRFRAKNSLRREGRLSPIRSFRTGFNKTSQLLATELVAALKSQGGDGKLVAFSDSREDAANMALEVEVQHQVDLRREILMAAAERLATTKAFNPGDDAEIDRLSKEISRLVNSEDEADQERVDAMTAERKVLRERKKAAQFPPSLPLSELFEFNRGRVGDEVRPIVGGLLELGALPVKGADTWMNRVKNRPWYVFFEGKSGETNWKTDAAEPLHSDIQAARNRVNEEQIVEATDLLFSKTYFALEETGLGWPSFFGPSEYTNESSKKDAWLRLFADAYRVVPNEFQETVRKNWNDAHDMLGAKRNGRLAILLERLFADPEAAANAFLHELGSTLQNRTGGSIDVTKLFFRIAPQDAPAWRCKKCGRVHLHRGFGKCTRCGEIFDDSTSLTAGIVVASNFLGRRVVRSVKGKEKLFRLRCEELTGQTEDPAGRLQQFKNVFVREEGETPGDFNLRRKFDEVDLLSVTTTMEVGVDIGSLQAVFQGNMPPQRFNYQQRVGRAGRRGQAFSVVLTVCRSKSHDIHYFRNPLDMTGAAPPPPFITTGLVDIPSRLLRKFWLVEAFNLLRARSNGAWPGDSVVPGDIHGEFIYCREYFREDTNWPELLRSALRETVQPYEAMAQVLADGAGCAADDLKTTVNENTVLQHIESLRGEFGMQSIGIASALAERGLVPMYGMPTRSRDLYVKLLWKGPAEERELEWDKVDRDQDLAIFDFAPGNIRTREKLHHRSIGFTGTLPTPMQQSGADYTKPQPPFSSWMKDEFDLGYCPSCGAWSRGGATCGSCGAELTDVPIHCLTPSAYRTDFRPKEESLAAKVGQRITLASLGRPDQTVTKGNLRVHFAESSEVFNINPGPRNETSFDGFEIIPAIDAKAERLPFAPWRLQLSDQALLSQVVTDDDDARFTATGDSLTRWLASPKVTNSLQIGPADLNPRLRLDELDGGLTGHRSPSRTSVRAAAISATELIVQRAALELDIAPNEFEALAPNNSPSADGRPMPFLQIADTLPNGSGFCRYLLSDKRAPVTRLIDSILDDPSAWPRSAMSAKDHRAACATSCYRCLQRYDNRNYHGLLDWRLGLSYLRALRDPAYQCGLDGDFGAFELDDWEETAGRAALQSRTFVPGNRTQVVGSAIRLHAFSLTDASNSWAVVVHPLWKRTGLLNLLGVQGPFVPIDTFELARRPLNAIERARSQLRQT